MSMEVKISTGVNVMDAIRIVPVTSYGPAEAVDGAVITQGSYKAFDGTSQVPEGYTCVGIRGARMRYVSDASMVLARTNWSNPAIVEFCNLSPDTPIYATDEVSGQSGKYYEMSMNLVCVRSDLAPA